MSAKRKRILIVRLGSMGDIIHTLPLAATLKENFPDWQVDWLIEHRWRVLLEENPYLSRTIEVDTLAWRKRPLSPGTWNSLRNTILVLKQRGYDCAIDAQGAIKSAVACAVGGAREVVGFDKPWLKEPPCAALYTRRVQSNAVHIVEANLALAAALGAEHPLVCFPLPLGDPASLPRVCAEHAFAVLNPGAGWRSKCWPPEHYAAIADALEEEFAFQVVLNCGPGERPLADRVIETCRTANPQTYFGDLKGLIALLRRSRLMVGPDTGPLHLAAALGVPTVGLFGPTDPRRNGPYGDRQTCLRAEHAHTSYRHSAAESQALRAITPARLMQAVRELLEREQTSPEHCQPAYD